MFAGKFAIARFIKLGLLFARASSSPEQPVVSSFPSGAPATS